MPEKFSMPDYTRNAQQLVNATNEINPLLDRVYQIVGEELKINGTQKLTFDHRDMGPLGLLIPQGKEHEQQVRQMCKDFKSKNPAHIKPWLDMLYDFRDSMNVSNLDLNNPQVAQNTVKLVAINQTVGCMEKTYPAYDAQRYPENSQQKETSLRLDETHIRFGMMYQNLLQQSGVRLNTSMTLPIGIHGVANDFQVLQAKVTDYEMQIEGKQFDKIPFVVSPQMNIYKTFDYTNVPSNDRFPDDKMYAAQDSIDPTFSATADAAAKLGMSRNDMLFIDGKSVNEIINERQKGEISERDRNNLATSIIATAMVSGKNRISAVALVKDAEGKLTPQMQEVKPDLTALGDTIKDDYSPIRRALFNWGPFKCKSRQEKTDELYSKPIPKEMQSKLDDKLATISTKAEMHNQSITAQKTDNAPQTRREAVREAVSVKKLIQEEPQREAEKNDRARVTKAPQAPQKAPQELNM